ncbi:4'-phosphopantetheinyl transferase family protein [Apilactobacillus zhangqiuensis]|uniref:4'-phosphopantetheinyl transferase family protein n=1 Tax=Apilactobacillus zhangqiuensis TaxID=2841031 RepID=UPI001C7D7E78|nr:4'-phosphopantetheinyl transferase superfamily protein [Apilactobacillus zhangqiuensis]
MLNNTEIFIDSIQNPKYQEIFKKADVDFTKYNKRQAIVGNLMLADYMGISIDELLHGDLFYYGDHGKPFLKSNQFQYNISNSYDLVILAVSNQEIGIDIEKLRPFTYKRITRAFTDKELDYLSNLDESVEGDETLKLWTIKESALKLVGTGLSGKVKSVDIDVDTKKSAKRLDRKIKLTDIEIADGYVGTLATYDD